MTGNVIDGNGQGIIFGGVGHEASDNNVIEHNLITNPRSATTSSATGARRAVGRGNIVRQNCIWGGEQGNIQPALRFHRERQHRREPAVHGRDAGDFRLRRVAVRGLYRVTPCPALRRPRTQRRQNFRPHEPGRLGRSRRRRYEGDAPVLPAGPPRSGKPVARRGRKPEISLLARRLGRRREGPMSIRPYALRLALSLTVACSALPPSPSPPEAAVPCTRSPRPPVGTRRPGPRPRRSEPRRSWSARSPRARPVACGPATYSSGNREGLEPGITLASFPGRTSDAPGPAVDRTADGVTVEELDLDGATTTISSPTVNADDARLPRQRDHQRPHRDLLQPRHAPARAAPTRP